MKTIFPNIQAHPERKKKQELLKEMGLLPPMNSFEEGGEIYRKLANFYPRIYRGEMSMSDPEYKKWTSNQPYNYRRALKYTRRKG